MLYFCWFDDSKQRSLVQKIHNAIEHYKERYGMPPNIVQIRQADAAQLTQLDNVRIDGKPYIQQHHIWVGVDLRYEHEENRA